METTPQAIFEFNGKKYDIATASPEARALLQDLATVQNELQRIKIQQDITLIAKQSIVGAIANLINAGQSGLVELETETSNTAVTEGEVAE